MEAETIMGALLVGGAVAIATTMLFGEQAEATPVTVGGGSIGVPLPPPPETKKAQQPAISYNINIKAPDIPHRDRTTWTPERVTKTETKKASKRVDVDVVKKTVETVYKKEPVTVISDYSTAERLAREGVEGMSVAGGYVVPKKQVNPFTQPSLFSSYSIFQGGVV